MKRKKTKKYGKTTKQWNNLYKKYRDDLKGERNITRMNKTEFIQEYINKDKKTTIKDLANKTRKESSFDQYSRIYERAERRGISLGSKLSYNAFEQQKNAYSSLESLVQNQQFISNKQAKSWAEHARMLGFEYSELDFLKENESADDFWNFIAMKGGWEEVFEYGI